MGAHGQAASASEAMVQCTAQTCRNKEGAIPRRARRQLHWLCHVCALLSHLACPAQDALDLAPATTVTAAAVSVVGKVAAFVAPAATAGLSG